MPPHSGLEEEADSEQSIQQLTEWVAKQPHLPTVPNRLLLRLLYSCYGSVERTKTTIDSFFTISTHAREIFGDLSVLDERHESAMSVIYAYDLKQVNKEGYHAFFFKFQDLDANKFDFPNILRAGVRCFYSIQDEDDRVPGYRVLFDFSGVTMSHILRMSLTNLKQIVTFVQDGLPIRLKGIHFINVVPIIQNIVSLLKPLMKKELLEMFHVHSVDDMPNFYSTFVPQKFMPSEYGGSGLNLRDGHEHVLSLVKSHVDYLAELDGLVVDESKRSGASKNSSEVFGIQGSFKKLDLD